MNVRERIVRGHGSYVGDILPPGTRHAAFVRCALPFATIQSIDVSAALDQPGVGEAYTGRDLREWVRPLRIEGPGLLAYDWYPMAVDRALYAEEAVAVVLADDPYVAEDALEMVDVDLQAHEPVLDIESALGLTAPYLHPEGSSNVLFEAIRSGGDPETCFASAPIVVDRTFHHGRQTPFPLEPRGVLAMVERSTGDLLVWTSTQIPHIARTAIATALGRRENSVRVITPQVGGGFGLKCHVFGEEIVVAWLALHTGSPVRWLEDRRENLMASAHSHDQTMRVRVAADHTGKILAADIDVTVDVGAHSIYPLSASLEPMTTAGGILSCYDIPNLRFRTRGVATNKCMVGAYRGVGAPASSFATERILDLLAWQLQVDPAEIRMRNLIHPETMPYTTATGVKYDSGDYPQALRTVLDRADYAGLVKQRSQATEDAPILGIGIAVFNEHSGPGSRAYRARGVATVPGFDTARVHMEPAGAVSLYVSSAEAGQNHAEFFRLAAARELNIDPRTITVVEGDTSSCPHGTGTFASRAGTAQVSAVAVASRRLQARLTHIASMLMECAVGEVCLAEGGYKSADRSKRVGLVDVAETAYLRRGDFMPPPGFEPGLDEVGVWDPIPTYPYGAHVSVVHLDPKTFQVRLVNHVAVEDCGVIISEGGVHEQLVGAIVMGIGNALYEEHHYDSNGQLQTSSLLDYLVPLATDVPPLDLITMVTPTDRTPLGTKGMAEGGTIGAVAAVGAAVADALRQLGAELNDLPASPERLFRVCQASSSPAAPSR